VSLHKPHTFTKQYFCSQNVDSFLPTFLTVLTASFPFKWAASLLINQSSDLYDSRSTFNRLEEDSEISQVGFEVLTAVSMKMVIF
jgi:hypothetical protein